MSAIYKLSIQGIRSFDSNDRETIEFGTPLTLIVGMNGSGKTTIIECLKYATTGDLPPNSKGGVFVHDPKITGEKDIRAQVKLAFISANGLNMIVTRNIQLLAKKTTNTFKTLEGQLVAINKARERTTLSTRSLELDIQVPLYMGVPKAILEYVIFCHQEDSLWPLSEPSNLKKKFDEIFQAMKFTKALDSLKTIKKDMAIDIKLLKQSVEHMKLDRDRSKATKMNVYQIEAKISEYQDQVKRIEAQLNDVTEKSDKLFKNNKDFQEVLSKVDTLKTLKSVHENDIERLNNSIELIDLPKDELEKLLENFSITLSEKETEIQNKEESIKSMKDEAANFQSYCNDLIRQQGELKAKETAYYINQKQIEILQNSLCETHKINGTNIPREKFMQTLETTKANIKSEFDMFSQEASNSIEKLETKLKGIIYSETVQQQKLDYNESDKTKLEQLISNMETDVKTAQYTNDDIIKEKNEINKLNANLADLEKETSSHLIADKIKHKNNSIILLESTIEDIQNKITKTNQQAELFAKLDLTKNSLKEKQSTYKKLLDQLREDEKYKSWDLKGNNDLDIDFKKSFIDLQKRIAISNKEYNDKDKTFNEFNFHRSKLEKEIEINERSRTELVKTLKESLPDDCPIEEYYDVIDEAELSYKTALENLKMHQTTLEFNRKALEVAEDRNCCYLCSRMFETSEFKSKLLIELKQKTDAKFEKALEETVKEEKSFLEELRALEKNVIELESLNEKGTKLLEQLKRLLNDSSTFEEDVQKAEDINKMLKNDKEHAENILRPLIEKFIYIKKEISDLEGESHSISDELKIYGNDDGIVQTVSELQLEQKKKNEEMRQLRKEINELQDLRETKTRMHSNLVNKIRDKSNVVNEIERSLSKTEGLSSEILKGKSDLQKLDNDLVFLRNELINLHESRTRFQDNLNQKRTYYNNEIDLKRNVVLEYEKDTEKYSNLLQEIKDYESLGSEKLSECIKQYGTNNDKLHVLNKKIDEEYEKLNITKQKLKDSSNEQRNLRSNIDLAVIKSTLQNINRELVELNVQKAEAEREKYQEESSRLRNLYESLSSENAGKLGEIKQLQNQINSLNQQLRSDYKDIDEKYHKEWVELQTRTFVTDDIDTYSKTLDNAIMRYHGLKMEDINRIIDELWKRTYSGTDIDTIKIRSDEVSNTARSKSYNYRVVMYKQDAELDMRGRCSAGQKVLASIIIRLALSETFGINCGVIALDEPTTNLDEENIESLAKSLSNIIKFRRHQKNFQLIVITHDEKFLNYMNASDFTDHFFKVKRDDRQKSQIEWVDINKVTES